MLGFLSKINSFHDGDPYHIETSPLIYRVNQCTGFYIISTSVMKELMLDIPDLPQDVPSRQLHVQS